MHQESEAVSAMRMRIPLLSSPLPFPPHQLPFPLLSSPLFTFSKMDEWTVHLPDLLGVLVYSQVVRLHSVSDESRFTV